MRVSKGRKEVWVRGEGRREVRIKGYGSVGRREGGEKGSDEGRQREE